MAFTGITAERLYNYYRLFSQENLRRFISFASKIGNEYYKDASTAWNRAERYFNEKDFVNAAKQLDLVKSLLPNANIYFRNALELEDQKWFSFNKRDNKQKIVHSLQGVIEKEVLIYFGLNMKDNYEDKIHQANIIIDKCPNKKNECQYCKKHLERINKIATKLLGYSNDPVYLTQYSDNSDGFDGDIFYDRTGPDWPWRM